MAVVLAQKESPADCPDRHGRDEYGSIFADQVLTENVSKMAAAYSSDVISDECNHSESRLGEARFLAQVDGACITGGGTFRRRLSTGSRFEK
jgi:hypothetical protein